MVNRPSTPEIITVNSEALQTQIRDLLPSQNGFGSELQASNVITPVIDLTRAAEGSSTPEILQTAIAFGSQTAFSVNNATQTTIINQAGFFRVFGCASCSTSGTMQFEMTDGFASKVIWRANGGGVAIQDFDFVVFLRAGDSLTATANTTSTQVTGSTRQIATGDGTLVQPVGFPL